MERKLAIDIDSTPERGRLDFECGRNASVSEAVINAVSTVAAVDPLELETLHSVIDPDALDRVFAPKLNGQPRNGNTVVVFRFGGHEVQVRSGGRISVRTDGE